MTNERSYPVISLDKDDVRELFRDPVTRRLPAAWKRVIDSLTEVDMRHLAAELAEAFCNCCFWDSLTMIVEDYTESGEPAVDV